MKLSTPFKSVIAITGLALTTTAFAGDEYRLSYKESELRSSEGVSVVHARIVAAAKDYCPSYKELGSVRELKMCLEDVTNDLVSKIDHPTLSSYHSREAGVELAKLAETSAVDPS